MMKPVSWKKAQSKTVTYLPVIQVLEDRLPPGEAFGLSSLALGGGARLFSTLSPELTPVAILPPDYQTDSSRVTEVSFGWADPLVPSDHFGDWAANLSGHTLETSAARSQPQTPAPPLAGGHQKENPNLLALRTDFLDDLLEDLNDLSHPPRTDVASHSHPLNHEGGSGDAPVRTATLSDAGSHAPVTSDPESGPAGSLGGRGHGLIQPLQPSASDYGPGSDPHLPRLADSGGCSGGSGGSGGCCGTITAQGVNVNAVEAQSIAASGGGLVATFSDSDPNSQASDFSATIMWGDNSSSGGFIGGNSTSGFTVSGDHTYLEEGTFTITVKITDRCNNTVTTTSTATVADAPLSWVPNPPTFSWSNGPAHPAPSLTNPGNQTNAEGNHVSLQIVGSDPDGDSVTYSAVGLPKGLSISGSGLISGTVDTFASTGGVNGSGTYYVTVVAADGHGGSTSTSFNWLITHTDVGPTLANPGNQSSIEGDSPWFLLSASDPDGDPLTYGATGLPPGVTVDPQTGQVSGMISYTAAANSPYTVTATATDGSVVASQTFTWTVQNGPPSVTYPGNQRNAQGDTVSLQIMADDPHNSPLTYSATGLPPGLGINTTTGLISGMISLTAATGSPYTVTVQASNGSQTAPQTFTWTVTHVAVNNPGNRTNDAGTTVSLQIQARDNDGDPLTYGATGLPPGLSIASGTGLISGTLASNAYNGSPYTVMVTASDSTNSDKQTFTWTVTHSTFNNPPVITNPGNQTSNEDDTISLAIQASDPEGDQLTYSATGLPSGLSIDATTGIITGEIDDDAFSTSPFSVTVSVSDGNGGNASTTFQWQFIAPVISATGVAVTATEGTKFSNVTVANFNVSQAGNDSDSFDYQATINWGDNSSDTGYITGSGTSYSVQGSHTYTSAGPFTISVTVADAAITSTSTTATATVQDAALSATAIAVNTVVGSGASVPVAILTDQNPYDSSSDYTVSINWGNNLMGSGYASGMNGKYIVYGSPPYSMHGSYSVSVTITDRENSKTTVSTTATIGDIYEGLQANLTVAQFRDADPNDMPNEYITSINWGDGSGATPGMVSGLGGLFSVSGNHTYTALGQYTVTVTVRDVGGSMVSYSQPVIVSELPLSAYTAPIYAYAGEAWGSAPVAIFTDPDPNGSSSGASATIDWGDGSSGSASVSSAGGLFTVSGGHTYANTGTYPVIASLLPAGAPLVPVLFMAMADADKKVKVDPKSDKKDGAGGTLKWTLAAPKPLGGNARGDVQFDVEFEPSKGCACQNIVFLQTNTVSTIGGKAWYPNPAEFYEKFATDKTKGNQLDFIKGETDPYYNAEWDGTKWVAEAGNNSQIGKGKPKTDATTRDRPWLAAARTGKGEVIFQFETAAFCIDSQEVLGVISWGMKVPDNNKDPIQLLGATATDFSASFSADSKALIAKANAVGAEKDLPMFHAQLDGSPKITKPQTDKIKLGGTSALP
jgi:hypothetical protein